MPIIYLKNILETSEEWYDYLVVIHEVPIPFSKIKYIDQVKKKKKKKSVKS